MPTLIHPYSDLTGGQWLRGNLHAHTTRSDGSRPPQGVIDDYAARGYGFLSLSDHDVYTSEADYAKLDARGMVLVPGNEVSAHGPHLLHVDADRFVAPLPGRQQTINDIVAAARETGRGFAVVNHPNWQGQFDHCTIAQMREWVGYAGMEIYNGLISRLDGSPYATDKWDMLLSGGRRVWGFANDDSHSEVGVETGWNVAYVKERSRAGVAEALRNGRFYCSTGVTIDAIEVDGLRVRVKSKGAQRIAAIRDIGSRFASVDGPELEVSVPKGAKYIRFTCWGTGERMAWTQPFYVEEGIDGPGSGGGSGFIADWKVSKLVAGAKLADARAEQAADLPAIAVTSQRSADQGLQGFADAREQIQGKAGVVYLTTEIASPADARGTLLFGYDGPIRVWLNGQMLFDGPGTNPAVIDNLKLYGSFRRGANRLVVALDSNGGRAWGIFGRVEWGELIGPALTARLNQTR